MSGHGARPEDAVEALSSTDPELRRAALGAAWRLGAIDGAGLFPFLTDADATVAGRAVELAARLPAGSPHRAEMGDRLLALLDGPLAEPAAFALGELGVDGPAVVTGLVDRAGGADDALVRESAVAALGALGVGLDAVLAAMTDVATVRRRAVIALANFEGPEVDAALAAAHDDRDWQVRQVAEDLHPLPAEGAVDDRANEPAANKPAANKPAANKPAANEPAADPGADDG